MFQKILNIIAISLAIFTFSQKAAFAQVGQTPKLEIITPQEGQAIYGNSLPTLFSVENFQITNFEQNPRKVAGQGHIHIWLDDQNPTAQSAQKATSNQFTYKDVNFGQHSLKAELVNNDHSSLNPPVVIKTNFKTAPTPSTSPTVTSGFDKNTALVILVIVSLVIVAAWWYTKEEEEPSVKSKVESQKSIKRTARKRRK